MTTSRSDWVTTARERTVAAIREGRIEDALAGVDAIWAEAGRSTISTATCARRSATSSPRSSARTASSARGAISATSSGSRCSREAAKAGGEALAGLYAMFLRSHGYDFRVEEDAEQVHVPSRLLPERSAPRWSRASWPGDARHPMQHGVTKAAQPWSFSKAGVPYYCGHTALWFDVMPREWNLPHDEWTLWGLRRGGARLGDAMHDVHPQTPAGQLTA